MRLTGQPIPPKLDGGVSIRWRWNSDSRLFLVKPLQKNSHISPLTFCLECGNAFGILKNNRSGWIAESIPMRRVALSVDLGGHTTNRLSVNGEGQEAPLFG